MDITSLLNKKSPEPEKVTGSRTNTTDITPPFIEPRPLNLPPLPAALQHSSNSGSQISPTLPHANQVLSLQQTSPREQSPRTTISTQLSQPTMSQIAYPSYPGSSHYTMPQPAVMQSPNSALSQSIVTDDSMDMSGINKTFPCQGCSKSFARKSDLVRHERIHSGERPHSCDFPGCDKHFIQRSALTVHKRVHTGEKPHKCQSCDKPFSDSSSLARHRRIHSGKRPYKCEVPTCQKTFTRKTTLKRHEQQHNPERDNMAPVKTEAGSYGQPSLGTQSSSSAKQEMADGESASETSEQAIDTLSATSGTFQLPGNYQDMNSYSGSGPAQYASKALDMNNQNSTGPYYRAHAYDHHTAQPRQAMPAAMTYHPTSSMGAEVLPVAYHTVGAAADAYEAARRASLPQGVPLYPSPDHHSRAAPFPTSQQHQQSYAAQEPRAGLPPQYQPAINDWSHQI